MNEPPDNEIIIAQFDNLTSHPEGMTGLRTRDAALEVDYAEIEKW